MYDLFVAADLVRKQMNEALGTDALPRPSRRPAPPRRRPVRSGSAAALRRLADLLEPSRSDTVTG
jgi:hypothetical protein